MASCNTTIGNMNLATCNVNLGRPLGLLLSLEQQTFATLATAESETNWDALFLADAPDKLIYMPASFFEKTPNEPIIENGDFEDTLIGIKGVADMIKLNSPNDWQKWDALLGEGINNRTTVYVAYVYANGYVVGQYNSDGVQVQFVKASAMKIIEPQTQSTTEKMALYITPKNPDVSDYHTATITALFALDFDEKSITDMVFTEVTSLTSALTFSVTDKANATLIISTLIAGDLTVTVDGAAQVLGALTYNAVTDQYTLLPYNVFDTGALILTYAKPSSSSLFYEQYGTMTGTVV